MILKNLKLTNYKQFKEKEIPFGMGINVIIGDNEAGKSTITQALLDAFYSDPTTQSKAFLDGIASWGSNELPRLELDFEHGIIGYNLIKDFQTKKAILTNIDSGEEITNPTDVNNQLAELLGLKTRTIFKNTALISHLDVSKIEDSRDFINALQNVANEAQEDIDLQSILANTDSEIRKMKLGIDRHANEPGPIKLSMDRIAELKNEIATKSQLVTKVNDYKEKGITASDNLKGIKEQIKDMETLLKNYEVFEQASSKLTQIDQSIKELEDKIRGYNELEAKKGQLKAELEPYEPFMKYDGEAASAKLTEIAHERKLLNQQIKEFEFDETPQKPVKKVSNLLIGVSIAYLVCGVAAGLIYHFYHNLLASTGIFALLLLLVTGVYMLLSMMKPAKTSNKTITDNINQLKLRVFELSKQIQAILDRFQCEDSSSFFTNKAKFKLVLENIKQIESKISGLLLNTSIDKIRSQQLELLQQKKNIEVNELTDDVKHAKITAREYLSYKRELDDLKTKEREMERALTVSKIKVEDADVDADYITKLEEELAFTRDDLVKDERKVKILEMVTDGIRESLKSTARTAGSIIEEVVNDDLKTITAGRYSKIQIGDSFAIKVFSKEKNDWIDPAAGLSSGTIDQIYFLTRIGFLTALVKDRMIPIICDDSFVTFDKKRRSGLLGVIKDLSDQFQILLFTVTPDYEDWGTVYKLS